MYIELQYHIAKILKGFREDVIKFMSYDPADISDPRNNIRKCPHCNEIWILAEGS